MAEPEQIGKKAIAKVALTALAATSIGTRTQDGLTAMFRHVDQEHPTSQKGTAVPPARPERYRA